MHMAGVWKTNCGIELTNKSVTLWLDVSAVIKKPTVLMPMMTLADCCKLWRISPPPVFAPASNEAPRTASHLT